MITIHKGDLIAKVSAGAFETIFKDQGWSMDDHKDPIISGMNLPDPDHEDVMEDEITNEDEDLSERPLSSLSLGELRQLAAQYGIDAENMRSKREIRNAIRETMNEED
jgi:hypothetical protein